MSAAEITYVTVADAQAQLAVETLQSLGVATTQSGAAEYAAFRNYIRGLVDRIYAIAEDAGLKLDRAPALAPHIHPNYYAGYLRDPDGRLIEFVCHKPE